MSRIDGFKLVDVAKSKEGPFITLRNTTITFSKEAIEKLQYAAYVHMFVNEETHQVAFQVCEPDDSAIEFYTEPEEGKQILVRLTGKDKARILMSLAGITDCGKGIRYYGDYYEDESLLICDLKS